MSKHTKGQWSYRQWRETDGEGELMAYGWQISSNGHLLPLCAQTGDDDEAEANARLIAAAPDLLDALMAADLAMANGGILACHASRKQTAAAIAKATGEAA